jgi:hypothetical protein
MDFPVIMKGLPIAIFKEIGFCSTENRKRKWFFTIPEAIPIISKKGSPRVTVTFATIPSVCRYNTRDRPKERALAVCVVSMFSSSL